MNAAGQEVGGGGEGRSAAEEARHRMMGGENAHRAEGHVDADAIAAGGLSDFAFFSRQVSAARCGWMTLTLDDIASGCRLWHERLAAMPAQPGLEEAKGHLRLAIQPEDDDPAGWHQCFDEAVAAARATAEANGTTLDEEACDELLCEMAREIWEERWGPMVASLPELDESGMLKA